MIEILSYPFMQRALIAALLTGLIAPAIGAYVVQRRLSLLGDGLGHVALAGVGLALLTGAAPIPIAVVTCVAGAVVVEILRQRGKATGDVGLAILFYGGLAAGVFLSGISGVGAGGLAQYLFGSLTTVTPSDLRLIAVLAGVILVTALGLTPQLYAASTDEEFARTQGLRVRLYHIAVVSLAAVTVALAMRTVGLLLVSALMVVPVAAARNLVRGFTAGLWCAIGIGVATAVGGAAASFWIDAAPGAFIVLMAIGVFILSWPISYLLRRRYAAAVLPEPVDDDELVSPHTVTENHPHRHAAGCGHPAVQHRDHTDFIHEGHRHAAHADHYDEH
ncbi:MAG TPA: metal ABC transporter permease [Propionibacteriaceae bacterium]|nr:metal ABC transporter permease [Propionibacteriaceae bacterium]